MKMKSMIIIGATMLVSLSACDAVDNGIAELQKATQKGWEYSTTVDKLTQIHSASATREFTDKDVDFVRVDMELTCENGKELIGKITTYDTRADKDGNMSGATMSYDSDDINIIETRSGKNKIRYFIEMPKYSNELKLDVAHPDMELTNLYGINHMRQYNLIEESASKMVDNQWIIRVKTELGDPTITVDLNDPVVKKVMSQCKWNPAFSPEWKDNHRKQIASIQANMVTIPSGSFQMGSHDGQFDEKPVHTVQISSFKMGKYEVTQGQWQTVMGSNPSRFKGVNYPVEKVNWDDIQVFLGKLNEQSGKSFRLPTEAEWEYAARAGTTSAFSTGACINTDQANFNGRFDYKDCGAKTFVDRDNTISVGSFSPNSFGLYDMHGNVREWVEDCWNGSYNGAPSNGAAWLSGTCERRVLRGGSWKLPPDFLRSACRFGNFADTRFYHYGFRLAQD